MALKYYNEHNFPLERGSIHSAGLDLHTPFLINLFSDQGHVVETGLYLEIPRGYVGLVTPRSSLGKRGMTLDNTIGVIDSDYRGEVKLLIRNESKHPLTILGGERIAQLILVPYFMPKPQQVLTRDHLSKTERGDGGFGSTG